MLIYFLVVSLSFFMVLSCGAMSNRAMLLRIFPVFGRSLSLKSGDALMDAARRISLEGNVAEKSISELSFSEEYKGYGMVLEQILLAHRRVGINLNKSIFSLRTNLHKDLLWEGKVLDETKNSMMQFFIISIITWAFGFSMAHSLNAPIPTLAIVLVLIFQLFGLIVYQLLETVLEKKLLQKYRTFDQKLCLLSLLLKTNLSYQETVEQSGIGAMLELSWEGELNKLAKAVTRMLKSWKYQGNSIDSELLEIRNEVSFVIDQKFQNYLGYLKAVKFTTLALFYLCPYFMLVGFILKSFLIE